jgi:hypothetical protein
VGRGKASNIHKCTEFLKASRVDKEIPLARVASHFGLEERIVSLRNMKIEKTICWKHPGTHRTGDCVL